MGPVAEKVLLLENIGTSVKVGPSQLPTLHHLLTEAAAILQMEAPDLYVRQVRSFVHCSILPLAARGCLPHSCHCVDGGA